jgi:hypothetical protein
MRGHLIDMSVGLNDRQRVTLEILGDFRCEYDRLKDGEVSFEIKKYRKRRSLDANAYAWVLIDKIAEAIAADKTTVYREAIRNIGGVSETVCVQGQAADKLRSAWESKGIGWQTETMPSKLDGCVNVVLYYGSSVYDTGQMCQLIDHLVSEAKGLGIETATPDQIARYKDEWDQRG